MKIIRWLLSHSLLILLIVVVIYGYMFWGNLAGETTPVGKVVAYLSDEFVEVEEFVEAIKTKQDQSVEAQNETSSRETSSRLAEATDNSEELASDDGVALLGVDDKKFSQSNNTEVINKKAEVINRDIEQQPVSISYSHNQKRVTQNSAGNVEVDVAKVYQGASPGAYPGAYPDQSNIATNSNSAENDLALAKNLENTTINKTQAVAIGEVSESLVSSADEKMSGDAGSTGKETKIATKETNNTQQYNSVYDTTNKPQSAANGGVGESMVATDTIAAATIATAMVTTADETSSGSSAFQDKETNAAQLDDTVKANDKVKATWITARKSYYQRNYALSEQSYQEVIDSTEDNFDAYGELGNVYFNQGKKEQAASAYFEAAAILVRKGQVKRAQSLLGLLRHLNKSKAKELQELIDTTLS